MRKTLLLLMAFTLFFAFSAGTVDARPKFGGIKSPKKSYTTTPSKPAENVNKSTPGTAGTPKTGTAAGRGFFSGGSLMRGLMIGGIAGLLFGSMLGTGFLSSFLGLLINVLAIYLVYKAIRGIFLYFRNRRKSTYPDDRRHS
jgi:predicted lipid-binding transport protein (Tim44 family)